MVLRRTENNDFREPRYTVTFNVQTAGTELNMIDNFDSTIVNVTRVADLQVARYVMCVVRGPHFSTNTYNGSNDRGCIM